MAIPIIIYLPDKNYFETAQRVLKEAELLSGWDIILLGEDINLLEVALLLTPGTTELFAGMEYSGETGSVMTTLLFQKIIRTNPQAILVGCSSRQEGWMKERYNVHHEAHLPADGGTVNTTTFAHRLVELIRQFNAGQLTQ